MNHQFFIKYLLRCQWVRDTSNDLDKLDDLCHLNVKEYEGVIHVRHSSSIETLEPYIKP